MDIQKVRRSDAVDRAHREQQDHQRCLPAPHEVFSAREFTPTATRMAAPEIAICQNGETSLIGRELRMLTSFAASCSHSTSLLLSSAMFTLPLTYAVIVCSSIPSADSVYA